MQKECQRDPDVLRIADQNLRRLVSSCLSERKDALKRNTIIPRDTIHGSVEVLIDGQSGSLSAKARAISIMIHEGYLEGRFIRRVEIILFAHVNCSFR